MCCGICAFERVCEEKSCQKVDDLKKKKLIECKYLLYVQKNLNLYKNYGIFPSCILNLVGVLGSSCLAYFDLLRNHIVTKNIRINILVTQRAANKPKNAKSPKENSASLFINRPNRRFWHIRRTRQAKGKGTKPIRFVIVFVSAQDYKKVREDREVYWCWVIFID